VLRICFEEGLTTKKVGIGTPMLHLARVFEVSPVPGCETGDHVC
jgi:hypothetical protein